MATKWHDYQEEAAAFFRALGMEAQTNVTQRGVRTSHDVDVLVKSHQAGFEITWIVECKLWNSRVTKLHVLALREIVADVGADRGILLAEQGVQSGASEAATLTNIRITSLAEVRETASAEVFSMRLAELYDRTVICKQQYWDIPKSKRIEYGLRGDLGQVSYTGNKIIELCEDLLKKGFRGRYPFELDEFDVLFAPQTPRKFDSIARLVSVLGTLITELEQKLSACISALEASD